jgi:hypothetical protein
VKKEDLELELYDSCLTLKNLALVSGSKPFSGEFIFQMLMENALRLKPIYREMLLLYRKGRDEEAFEYFADAVGTKSAKNFAAILSKLEKVNPHELIEQIEVFQSMMAEKRMTRAMKVAQRNSVLTTVWSTATVFAFIINFAVVAVFLDTLTMLATIF